MLKVLAAVILAMSGCSSPAEVVVDPLVCPATAQFLRFVGCADVEGTVVDAQGQPVPLVIISDPDDGDHDLPIQSQGPTRTDSEGSFRWRWSLTSPGGEDVGNPVNARIRATLQGGPRWTFVDILLNFFPVGEVPEPTVVQFTLLGT